MKPLVAFLVLVLVGPSAKASEPYMPTYGPKNEYSGAAQFCGSFPDECVVRGSTKRVVLTFARYRQLTLVNERVNREITFETDWEHFRKHEWWSLPLDGKGDCEDYAALKRNRLIALGWPSSSLLFTIVLDDGKGHAVLTVRTSQGDFILDNESHEIKRWGATDYIYIQRQSADHPRKWEWLTTKPFAKPIPYWLASNDSGPY